MGEKIDPKELIKTLSVEALCNTAEEYYRKIADPTPQMSKPFAFIQEAPDLLCKLGSLISGLKLGKSMIVLDFGAGTCWISRFFNQLQCCTISIDPSITALKIGEQLFEKYPIIGDPLQAPRFIHFNGHTIELEDESVDRIICFDTFHHIPNQREILGEFFRVLKPGGIAGFCEPGPHHSQSPQAQYEMRNYCVLENDIVLGEIKKDAEGIGFTNLSVKLLISPEADLVYSDYVEMTSHKIFSDKIRNYLFQSNENSLVFFLTKGKYIPDSRSHQGLKHRIEPAKRNYLAKFGEPIIIEVTISNIGNTNWLHKNIHDLGVVKLGMHLYDADRRLIDLDFFRSIFEEDILPGQEIMKRVSVTLPNKGIYYLGVDLVSELVCWFENMGSEPQFVRVTVE